MEIPLGVQLYNVRKEAENDYAGTLKKLADIGFKGIEFCSRRIMAAKDLKACMDKLDVVSIGFHVPFEELRDGLDQVLEYNLIIGSRYIVCLIMSSLEKRII
jgi:sugar phosphate isomerase/epimerase